MEVAAWYLDEAVVAIEGESKVFNGRRVNGVGPSAPGAGDVGIEYHFCTTCGSTVYWTFEDTPGITGISVGNFVDPTFHAPTLELHVAMRHRWVAPVAGAAQFDEWPPDYSWV